MINKCQRPWPINQCSIFLFLIESYCTAIIRQKVEGRSRLLSNLEVELFGVVGQPRWGLGLGQERQVPIVCRCHHCRLHCSALHSRPLLLSSLIPSHLFVSHLLVTDSKGIVVRGPRSQVNPQLSSSSLELPPTAASIDCFQRPGRPSSRK